MQEYKKNIRSKKTPMNLLLLVVNFLLIGIIVFNSFFKGDMIHFSDFYSFGIHYEFLLLCVVLLVSIIALDTLRYYQLIHFFSSIKTMRVAYYVESYGKYYDSITPLASGGQPFQVYFLTKSALPSGTAMSIPIARFIFGQIAILFLFFISIVYNFMFSNLNQGIVIFSILAFLGNFFILFFIFFLTFKPQLINRFMIWIISLLARIRLIKDKDKVYSSISNLMDKYAKNIKQLMRNPKFCLLQLIEAFGYSLLSYTFVYFIFLMFKDNVSVKVSYIEIVSLVCLCECVSSLMPLPGGTGAAELSFMGIFSRLFTFNNGKNAVLIAMLLWRFFTYYFYIIQGFIITLKDTLSGGIKKDRRIQYANLMRRRVDNKKRRAILDN